LGEEVKWLQLCRGYLLHIWREGQGQMEIWGGLGVKKGSSWNSMHGIIDWHGDERQRILRLCRVLRRW
jgi:hypothetical protein